MTVPTDYDITILHNGTDITQFCPFKDYALDDNHRSPSYFSFRIERPTTAPVQGDSIIVIANSLPDAPQIFNGFIMTMRQSKRDNSIGANVFYEVECGDNKVRLQKAVLGYGNYTGTPSQIIAGMFADTHPDLSQYFDFTSGVEDFADNLDFDTNDESLLDALNRFADRTGGNLRSIVNEGNGGIVLSFTPTKDIVEVGTENAGGATPYWYSYSAANYALSIKEDGNPAQCAGTGNRSYTAPTIRNATLRIHLGSAASVTNVSCDIRITLVSTSGAGGVSAVQLKKSTGLGDTDVYDTGLAASWRDGAWHHLDFASLAPSEFPFTPTLTFGEYYVAIRLQYGDTANGVINLQIDNVVIDATTTLQSGGRDQLQFQQNPDSAAFDFDIDLSDEFGSDFDLELGSLDDYNSITVVGGKELVQFLFEYESDGSGEHIQLEKPFRDITVYINQGSDLSSSWTALSCGVFGTDDLLQDGGTKDVLYDAEYHWLYFDVDSKPANMTRSIRVIGFIEKPIRVRVDNVGDGEDTFATVITNENIKSQEDAIAYANSLLAKKNAPRKMDFTTYEPGLQVGTELSIVDTARSLSETLLIRRINTKWIGSAQAEIVVECGEDDESELSSILAGVEKKTAKKTAAASITTPVIVIGVDVDGVDGLDTDGALLIEVDS